MLSSVPYNWNDLSHRRPALMVLTFPAAYHNRNVIFFSLVHIALLWLINFSSSFSQTMVSEWQIAIIVSHKMPWCALLTAVKNYKQSLEKLQDIFFKTETKNKTKCSRPRPRPKLHDPRRRPRFSFLSSRSLETKTLQVSRTTSLL